MLALTVWLAGFISRKLVYGLICEAVASYLAIAKLITGSEWVAPSRWRRVLSR